MPTYPALQVQSLNLPGIMQAAQSYRMGEAKLGQIQQQNRMQQMGQQYAQEALAGGEQARQTAMQHLWALDPDTAEKYEGHFAQMSDDKLEEQDATNVRMAQLAHHINEARNPLEKQTRWTEVRNSNPEIAQTMPETMDQDWLDLQGVKIMAADELVKARQGDGAEKGRRAAQAKTAEVEGILGRPATAQERQRAAGVAERTPIVSITQKGETEMAKQLGKLDAERVNKLEDDAQQAFRTLAEVERMSAAIESGRFTTGVFSDARVFLARLADFVGASEETRNLLGDAATADTLDAAANRLGVEAAQKLGRITNMSLQFVRDSLPSLVRTPEGNRILMEVMRRTAEREIKLASLAEDFLQRHGTLRPKDGRTYFQAVRDLEQEDPVITEELRQRIIKGSRQPAKPFKELFGGQDQVPEGFVIPPGFTFSRMEDGVVVIKDAAGKEFRQKVQ